jgi:hypothetical protein
VFKVAQPAVNQLELALEVAQARSRASSISTDKPRPAASAAIPAPLMPPYHNQIFGFHVRYLWHFRLSSQMFDIAQYSKQTRYW